MEKLKKVADKLLNEINETSVPVKTGKLLLSGHVVVNSDKEVEVVYDAPHASYVHEMPSGIGYKFAERVADRMEDALVDMYEDMVINDFLNEI